MNSLKLSIFQFDIVWEDKEANLNTVERLLASSQETHDIVVLPEMFSTGFSMQSEQLAEESGGKTMQRIKSLAQKYDAAICGSFIAKDKGNYFNRGFFITPHEEHFYDKRHLFRMGSETKHFAAGNQRLIVSFRGFNICLLVCYDLRFPVWSRNVNNEYDLLIYIANWPEARANVWKALLPARALENVAYVCGANRTGRDGMKLNYTGDSAIYDFKGNSIINLAAEEKIITASISIENLRAFRDKFPVWKDGDKFELM